MKIFKSETSSESQKMRKRVFRDLNALESILEPNWISVSSNQYEPKYSIYNIKPLPAPEIS